MNEVMRWYLFHIYIRGTWARVQESGVLISLKLLQMTSVIFEAFVWPNSSQSIYGLTLQAPTPQNGQTYSNNSSTNSRRIV